MTAGQLLRQENEVRFFSVTIYFVVKRAKNHLVSFYVFSSHLKTKQLDFSEDLLDCDKMYK